MLKGIWRTSVAQTSWECLNKLLEDLGCRAPALRRLEFCFPVCNRVEGGVINSRPFPFSNLILRIALLSRLERLALKRWHCEKQEVALIAHLSRLQNLEVTPQLWRISDMFGFIRA